MLARTPERPQANTGAGATGVRGTAAPPISRRPADRRRTRLWACPGCHAVVAHMSLVDHCIGLLQVPPAWRCDECLEELRERELLSAAGHVGSTDDYVWAVAVLGERDGHGTSVVGRGTTTTACVGRGQ